MKNPSRVTDLLTQLVRAAITRERQAQRRVAQLEEELRIAKEELDIASSEKADAENLLIESEDCDGEEKS